MTDAVTSSRPSLGGQRSPIRSVLLHGALILFSLAMLYPILWMISGSLRPQEELFGSSSLIPSSVDLGGYIRGWTGLRVSFGQFFWNSLFIAVLATIGNVVGCSLAAFAFARLRFGGRNFWFALMLGTLMLPYHVVLIPQYILFLELGWVNTSLPLIVPKYLATDAFFIFLMVQFFRGIPRELDEAAVMDGCSPFRIYWKIMLPLSLPVLATAAIFSFIWTWDDFFGPLIYLNDINTYTVQLGLRSFVDSTGSSDWTALFAMSNLSLVPVFLFFLFFQRLLIEGIATTGMKR
ncbi:carbohydrate ABC transporter permease [Rhizobium sp. LC145]|uniref:carbohydrate ABC transporter permease n=1 Tax=Rhizobium sp. LC145 TaxID=1120688 RepID=UPI00062A1F56|nr:carbohydrate ABC transporter permease [Rhizobium sp. LC145]KKX27580.1 sugar ABC transporter permease [Rhizobium sp. LC145]TKT54527.1 carbohydrate ABC transporter permease [Rhizobiaceae bacterium LC148]